MYARGILFGKMVIELGDACTARNDAHDLYADIEFKTKGFFSGTYNAIAGRVKRGTTDLGDVSGKWSALMEFKTAKVRPPHLHLIPLTNPPVTRPGRSARYSMCRNTAAPSRPSGSPQRTRRTPTSPAGSGATSPAPS